MFAVVGALLLAAAVVLGVLGSFAYLALAALGLFFVAAALISRAAPPPPNQEVGEASLLGSLRYALSILLWVALLLGCNSRTSERWQIAEAYVGWVVIQYNSPACAPLPVEGGYRVLRISANGRLCTSESPSGGEAFDKFEYVKADGTALEIDQRALVHGGMVSSTGRGFIFIGTDEQWRSSPDTADSLNRRCTPELRC